MVIANEDHYRLWLPNRQAALRSRNESARLIRVDPAGTLRLMANHFLSPEYLTKLPGRNKHGLFALLNLFVAERWGGESCTVPQSRFASRLGVTERTVRAWQARLEALGVIRVVRSIGKKCTVFVHALPTDPGKKRRGTPERSSPAQRWRIYGSRARSDQGSSQSVASPGRKELREPAVAQADRVPVPGWLATISASLRAGMPLKVALGLAPVPDRARAAPAT